MSSTIFDSVNGTCALHGIKSSYYFIAARTENWKWKIWYTVWPSNTRLEATGNGTVQLIDRAFTNFVLFFHFKLKMSIHWAAQFGSRLRIYMHMADTVQTFYGAHVHTTANVSKKKNRRMYISTKLFHVQLVSYAKLYWRIGVFSICKMQNTYVREMCDARSASAVASH